MPVARLRGMENLKVEILKTLAADHREIESLLNRLELTTDRGVKTREKLFMQFRALLDAHAKAEEVVLYESLKTAGDAERARALESVEEHHVAKVLLRELSLLPKESERWIAKLKVLKDALGHHIREEEGVVFKMARKSFDAEELLAMNAEFLTLKKATQAGYGLPLRVAARAVRRIAS